MWIYGHPLFAARDLSSDAPKLMHATRPVGIRKWDNVRSNPHTIHAVHQFIVATCSLFLREAKILKAAAEAAAENDDIVNKWLKGITEHTSHILHTGSRYIQLPPEEPRSTILDASKVLLHEPAQLAAQ